MKTPIFGPSYVTRSKNLAANRLVNLYPEFVETAHAGRAPAALYLCPGLDGQLTLGDSPIKAMHTVDAGPSGSLMFVVAGSHLYQVGVTAGGYAVQTLASTVVGTGAATILDNGGLVFVFVGQNGYFWDGTAFNPITLPFTASGTEPIRPAYLDGFVLINWPSTVRQSAVQIFQSDLLAGTFDAANFASATADSDTIAALVSQHGEIVVLKRRTTEFWYNAGTTGFAFARIDGPFPQWGLHAVESVARVGESLNFLGQNEEGVRIVLELDGHTMKRISTHAIEDAIQGYSTASDAVAYSYQVRGHQFYVLNFPTADATWVYDKTASAQSKEQMWHERARWEPTTGQFHRHIGQHSAVFDGKVWVSDYSNGNLYTYNPDTLTDNGAQRKWLRSWRATEKSLMVPITFSKLQLEMQTGLQVAADANPQIMLRWSDDGANNWSNEHLAPAGKIGQTSRRVVWRRMGQTREATGLDRIFEISGTDPFPVAIVGAELDAA